MLEVVGRRQGIKRKREVLFAGVKRHKDHDELLHLTAALSSIQAAHSEALQPMPCLRLRACVCVLVFLNKRRM